MTSWYLRREYEFSFGGDLYKSGNDFQEIACPNCGVKIHGRDTHTWKNRDFPKDFNEVNYHYNLASGLGPLERIAFFYLDKEDPPLEGIFPANGKVFHLAIKTLPPDVRQRWPGSLRKDEIERHGQTLQGGRTSEEHFR